MVYSTNQIISALLHSDQDAAMAARYIRKKADFAEQVAVVAKLPLDNSRTIDQFTGTCFASGWKSVWVGNALPRITNSQKALNWFMALASRFAPELSKHAELRMELSRAAMLGQWDKAKAIVQSHQDRFGPTFWGMSWLFVITEESDGTAMRIKLVEYFASDEFGSAIPAFAKLYAMSCDKTLPEEHFRRVIRRNIPESQGSFGAFLEMLLLEDVSRHWTVSDVMGPCELLTLVDRYEYFLRMVAIAYGSQHDESLRLGKTATQLATLIIDPCLAYLADCARGSGAVASCSETEDLIKMWDAYMVSDYEKSLKLGENIVAKRPELLLAHEVLVKSTMYLGRSHDLSGGTPLALLWQHLRNVFSKNDHSEDSLGYLIRFAGR
jgi:hypothetical protein